MNILSHSALSNSFTNIYFGTHNNVKFDDQCSEIKSEHTVLSFTEESDDDVEDGVSSEFYPVSEILVQTSE